MDKETKTILKNIKNGRIHALKNDIGFLEGYINRYKGAKEKGYQFLIWTTKELIKAKKSVIKKIEKKYDSLVKEANRYGKNKNKI